MKRLLIAFLCLAALAAAAQDTKPLVDAAKDAKAKRKKSTTKVITNADVKKSAGKLAPARPAVAAKPAPPKPKPVDEDELYRQRVAADAALAEAQQKVVDLERELRSVEESFYAENDPEVRDRVIAKKFAETRDRLEKARTDLKMVSIQRSAIGDRTGAPDRRPPIADRQKNP
ncbi:MAG TPA: hypothetical protein VGR02_18260 [Thermoanaerobaculia bacterium]|jgi:hypothetical protein|nr:hypothetical protein [Thermoanaerobaculia bacterium]